MNHVIRRPMTLLAALAAALSLWGCATPRERVVAADAGCAELKGIAIPASAIGLPSRGATITLTELVPAKGEGPAAIGEYCKVLASVHPVSANTPNINFQLDLPTAWNGKALMLGGGGYNGTIRDPAAHVPLGAADRPTPLGRGYATWNSDSGHQSAAPYTGRHAGLDGRFGVSHEATHNFAGDVVKKTRDAVMHVMNIRYGRLPSKTYIAGGSTGGREAFVAVQRYPRDFDGAIAWYPAWNAAALNLQFGRITRALAAPGAYAGVAKRNMLYDAVMSACDSLDGLRDGIISNVNACRFNPATVRCPNGADTGDSCLSDAQIGAFNTYSTPITLRYPLRSGEKSYPGFDVYAGIDTVGINPVASLLTLNTAQPKHPATLDMPYSAQFWDMWVRYFVAADADANALQLDPEKPGVHEKRISELTALQDINSTDLSTFQRRGGKLLIAHGTADALVNVRATSEYFRRLVGTMGADNANQFVRYYEVPGLGHVFGKSFTATWDSLTALENWVERGVAPRDQVTFDANAATRGRSRPLCEYPAWPKYNGSGDANLAASFSCAN